MSRLGMRRGSCNRGMALVLVLAALVFLAALSLQLMQSVNRQTDAAFGLARQLRLDALLLGGQELARAALLMDQSKNQFDSFFDVWNRLDETRIQALAGGDSKLTVRIADLSGRLQVNALGKTADERPPEAGAADRAQAEAQARARYRKVWRRFLASGRFAIQPEEIDPLLDALADWVDRDQTERPLGAEDGWYQAQEPPYAPRNAPIRSEEELLLVRGMSRALLYGDAEHEGIAAYITVLGDDAMLNPNTAPEAVLLALLPEMRKDNVRNIGAFRSDPENLAALADPGWLALVPGLPADLGGDMPLFTVKSRFFAVQVLAWQGRFRRLGSGLIERRDQGAPVLRHWQID